MDQRTEIGTACFAWQCALFSITSVQQSKLYLKIALHLLSYALVCPFLRALGELLHL